MQMFAAVQFLSRFSPGPFATNMPYMKSVVIMAVQRKRHV